MPRTIPAGRFDDLIRHATEEFIARGYRRTQMADIAAAVGVSKPTLYLYVESKEALFALCCQHVDESGMLELPEELPIATPPAGSASLYLAKRLDLAAALPRLTAALTRKRAEDIPSELRGVVDELYSQIEAHCRGLKLLDRCWDHPEFGPAWSEHGRFGPRDRLVEYLALRIRAGQIPTHAEPRLMARIALETAVTWAMHIKWDRAPEPFDPRAAREAVVAFIVRGLLSPPLSESSKSDPTARPQLEGENP